MIVIFLLIPLSIVIAICFLAAFIWAVRSGQYEDTCTPSMRLLLEEKRGLEAKPAESPATEAAPKNKLSGAKNE
jgi:cbb3-type cytochrome oxidase maturation protein